jgi:hypothetical protein
VWIDRTIVAIDTKGKHLLDEDSARRSTIVARDSQSRQWQPPLSKSPMEIRIPDYLTSFHGWAYVHPHAVKVFGTRLAHQSHRGEVSPIAAHSAH